MKFFFIIIAVSFLISCNSVNKVLKSKDPEYKLRMAENYYVKKKYNQAQVLYEDVMPYFKTGKEFEDIYYKYAYTAYYQKDYLNAENLFKTYLEVFPTSQRAEEMEFMRAYTYFKQSPKPELDQTNTIKAMGLMQTFINTHPGSPRNKEAAEIIELSRRKLEEKDYKAAKLYFDVGQYRAAAVAYNTLLNSFIDSEKGDEYKFMAIKSYFKFAELSIEDKKAERFEKVIEECSEFIYLFPESSFAKQVEEYLTLAKNNLNNLTDEQNKKTT